MHHRIHTGQPLDPGGEVTITGEEFHHAARVVRLRMNEAVELFDGKGTAAAGTVTAIERDAIRVRIERVVDPRESPLRVTLAMAIVQLEKFELVLQKATELGAAAIMPLVTDRVELRPERYRGKAERWEKIVLEAVKQSGRAAIPSLAAPLPFSDAIRREGLKVLCHETGVRANALPAAGSVTIFVGPEGGWSDEELAAAGEAQCAFLRLGPRRLRAETAAIAAMTIIAAHHGDI